MLTYICTFVQCTYTTIPHADRDNGSLSRPVHFRVYEVVVANEQHVLTHKNPYIYRPFHIKINQK